MEYKHHTERCPHKIALSLRCEECSGKWKGGQNPEPRPGRRYQPNRRKLARERDLLRR